MLLLSQYVKVVYFSEFLLGLLNEWIHGALQGFGIGAAIHCSLVSQTWDTQAGEPERASLMCLWIQLLPMTAITRTCV